MRAEFFTAVKVGIVGDDTLLLIGGFRRFGRIQLPPCAGYKISSVKLIVC